jgi:CD109 antigen
VAFPLRLFVFSHFLRPPKLILNPQPKLKASKKNSKYSEVIETSLDFLLRATAKCKTTVEISEVRDAKDVYGFLLTTYALHVAQHEEKDKYFRLVEKMAEESSEGGADGVLRHWEVTSDERERKTSWAKPLEVETTAYGLLIYMARGLVTESVPIVRWLLREQNAWGGFVSTSDTVVALTALGHFAQATRETDVDLNVS